ncbi:MAG: hypothetical protein OXF95_00120, partial [Rhodobacteraceae bacterium]|nr:hypothetical protein [Paracoccaceae bacterium]
SCIHSKYSKRAVFPPFFITKQKIRVVAWSTLPVNPYYPFIHIAAHLISPQWIFTHIWMV